MMKGQTEICGAKTRKGTCCMNIPMKNGRCRMHGGKSTGPKHLERLKGNKHAVGNKGRLTTGEYECITWERLEEREQEYLRQYFNLQPGDQITEKLEMEFVRQARMLQRMNEWDQDLEVHLHSLLGLEKAMTRVSGKMIRMIEEKFL